MSDALTDMVAGMVLQASALLIDWLPLIGIVLGLQLAVLLAFVARDLVSGRD